MPNGNVVRMPQAQPQDSGGWIWDGKCWVPDPAWCGPSPPGCFSELAKAEACWDQSKMLYDFLLKVVTDILTNNPDIIPPPPPIGPGQPIIGVTNGTEAPAGAVGEWFQNVVPVNFTAASQNTVINAGVLPTGDWNAWATFYPNAWVAGCAFGLSPVPPASQGAVMISSAMQALAGELGIPGGTPVSESDMQITCPVTRILSTAPLLMPFQVSTNFLAGGNAGTGDFIFSARRIR